MKKLLLTGLFATFGLTACGLTAYNPEPGQRVLLLGTGAGLNVGAAVLQL